MKAYFERHGCSLNYGETDLLCRAAFDKGWDLARTVEDADLLVLSTCVVVQGTEAKLLERIKVLARTGKPLVVYGCMVNVMADKVHRLAPDARLLPTEHLKAFGYILEHAGPPKANLNGEVHANIPIANGCKGHCTYCIARLARGDLRSRPLKEILTDVRGELALDTREVRLAAQDTALYSLDFKNGAGLPGLLTKITSLEGNFMVRVGMMNPDSALGDLDALVKAYSSPKVYKFLHVPVQSGSDRVLGLMGRDYKVSDFVRVVRRFKDAFPGLYLSTDIIAGFPGETANDHEATVGLLEQVRPDIVNLKGFSARPGTKAKAMPRRVDTAIVKARTKELHDIKKRISGENQETIVGKELKVLLTERPKPGSTMGRSMEYRPIAITGELRLGNFVQVRVTGVKGDFLLGTTL